MSLKLKRSESFYIREGWFEKAVNTINQKSPENIFRKNCGVKELGIGSNMVKGLKYWLEAAKIIEGKDNQLSDEFGKVLLTNDQYLDQKFSWFLIHYNLVSNQNDCPIFHFIFNADIQSFSKSDISEAIFERFEEEDPKVKKKAVDSDLSTFIKSYVTEEVITNPEDNYACPLAALKLIKKEKSQYRLTKPQYNSLSSLLVYYALMKLYPDTNHFDIDASMELENSPKKVFNLDKYMYIQYLDDLQRAGLITVNKTAGLNTVYFEKRCTLSELYQMEARR